MHALVCGRDHAFVQVQVANEFVRTHLSAERHEHLVIPEFWGLFLVMSLWAQLFLIHRHISEVSRECLICSHL